MTRFLTAEDFTETFGLAEVTQIAGVGNLNDPAGRSLDTAKVEAAITWAEDIFVGYARARYPVLETLTPGETPAVVKGLIADLARYRLRDKSGWQGQVAETVKDRYDAAIANIKAIAAGKFELPIAGLPANGEAGSVSSQAAVPTSPVQFMLHGWRS